MVHVEYPKIQNEIDHFFGGVHSLQRGIFTFIFKNIYKKEEKPSLLLGISLLMPTKEAM